MSQSIDLNADIGEGYDDEAILPFISSCNIACGGHIGDEETIATTLQHAVAAGVAAGAHPSYPDKEYFGRRSLTVDDETLEVALIEQLEMIKRIADEQGVALGHVKPHGALYNDAVGSPARARSIVSAMSAVLPEAIIVGAPFGALREEADATGISYRSEGFVDRQYLDDGTLMPRSREGAVIEDEARQLIQAVRLAQGQGAFGPGGEPVPLTVETLCLHGDTKGAAKNAAKIHAALLDRGIAVRAP
ncbi:MAG: 5-oxoprolinase subunit PxpA [Pseudomonadota bacterium]